jgi:hypothetical protein
MRHERCASNKPTRIQLLILIPKWNLQDISPEYRWPAPDTDKRGVLKTRMVDMQEMTRASMRAQLSRLSRAGVLPCAADSSCEPVNVTQVKMLHIRKCPAANGMKSITQISYSKTRTRKQNKILAEY